jgi:hypothetical protein
VSWSKRQRLLDSFGSSLNLGSMNEQQVPKTAEELVEQWRADLGRKIILIDETRDVLEGDHRQFIVFTAVVLEARTLLERLDLILKAREALPDISRNTSFKGKNLLHIMREEAFLPLVATIGKGLAPPARLFISATTIKNVQDSQAKVTITAANDTGRPREVRGPELKVALNLVRRLGEELVGPNGRVDVILDRSHALGLDPRTRLLAGDRFEGFFGKLLDGGPDFGMVADSDDGVFRDALLLPDFAGYLLVHKTAEKLKAERVQVSAQNPPFTFREVGSPELVPAIAAVAERR